MSFKQTNEELKTEIKKTLQIKCVLFYDFYKGLSDFIKALNVTYDISLEFKIFFLLLRKSLNKYYKRLEKTQKKNNPVKLAAMTFCQDFEKYIVQHIKKKDTILSSEIGILLLYIFYPSPEFIDLYNTHQKNMEENIISSFGNDTFESLFKPLFTVLNKGFNNPKVKQICASTEDNIELLLELETSQPEIERLTRELAKAKVEAKQDEVKCALLDRKIDKLLEALEHQQKILEQVQKDDDSFVKVDSPVEQSSPVKHSTADATGISKLGTGISDFASKVGNFLWSPFTKNHQAKYLKYKAKYLALKKLYN